MKKLFQTSINTSLIHISLLILRIGVGTFMLTHGLPKLEKLLGPDDIKFSDPLGIGTGSSLFFTVLAEAGCSILLILGLGTRLAAAGLSFTMFVIAFISHGDDPFKKKELALLYLLGYVVLLLCGPGKYSVDSLIGGKGRK